MLSCFMQKNRHEARQQKWIHIRTKLFLAHIVRQIAQYAPGTTPHISKIHCLYKQSYSMPAPRPLGVRRAVEVCRHLVIHLTSQFALVAWYPSAPRVSLRSHSARSAQPHCAHPRILAVARLRSYGWAQRRKLATVRRNCAGTATSK